MSADDLPEFPTVADIPPGTFWWRDAKDRYTIHLKGSGKLIAAGANLRKTILAARAYFAATPLQDKP